MLSWLLLFRFLFPCLGNSLAQVWSANCSKKVWTHFNLPNQFSMFSRFFNLLNVFHFLLHWILLSFSVWLDDGLLPSLKASCLDLIMFESWLDKVPNCRKSSSENYRSKESFGLPKASYACWNLVAAWFCIISCCVLLVWISKLCVVLFNSKLGRWFERVRSKLELVFLKSMVEGESAASILVAAG